MKKLLAVLQIIALLACIVEAQMRNKGNDELLGSVRTLRVETTKILRRGEIDDEARVLIYTAAYDTEMRVTEESRSIQNNPLVTKTVFFYNPDGQLIEAKQYNGNRFSNKTTYTYDASGRLIEEACQATDGTLLSTSVYTYDTTGNHTSVTQENSGSFHSVKLISIYDDKERLTEALMCSNNDEISSLSFITKENKDRNVIRPFNPTELLRSPACGNGFLLNGIKYAYGDKMEKEPTEILEYGAGLLNSKKVFTHDSKGRLAMITEYNTNGELRNKLAFTYKWDAAGNWTERVKSQSESGSNRFDPIEITHRTISYY